MPRCLQCRAAPAGRSPARRLHHGHPRRPDGRRAARPPPVRGARLRLARDLRQRPAADAGVGRAARRGRRAQRARNPHAAVRLRRIPLPDRRRHSDVAGRGGPAPRPRRLRRRNSCLLRPVGRGPDPQRRRRRGAPAHRRADRRRQLRQARPRRDPGDDPRPVPPLLRGEGRSLRPRLARARRAHPDGDHRGDGRARRLRPDHPRGVRRARHGQDVHVHRHRGAVARLHRRRLARHPLRDRGGADPPRRHRRPEGALPAEARQRRDPADRGVHRAQHRLGPRLAQDPRRSRRRRLQGDREQDLDHPRRPHRPDDADGPHRSEHQGLEGAEHAAGGKAARHRRRPVPGRRA